MDKQWFNDEMKKIDVPESDVRLAIKHGIAKANQDPRAKSRFKRQKVTSLIAASLIVGVIGTGFVEASSIGKLFSSFRDHVGENLAASKLVTELNERAESNNIGVTVTSVYYDAGIISVTFKADHFKAKSDDFYYDCKIGDGSSEWMSSATFGGRVTSSGDAIGQIKIHYPEKELPKNMTLPITLTSIGDLKGKWKFDLPIQQLDTKKIHVGNTVTSDDNEHALNLEMITVGKSSAVLDYKATHSLVGKDDLMRIEKVTDDQGKEIDVLGSGTEFGRKRVENRMESEERSIIGKIPDSAKSLIIYPYIRGVDPSITHSLSNKTPFEIQSTRTKTKMTVTQIKETRHELIVQYTLDYVDTKHKSIGEVENFGENMNLIDSSYVGKEDVPIGNEVKGSTVKVLDEDKLQFQATFKLDGEYGLDHFKLANYSIEVPFSILLPNTTLPPIKVDLK